MYFMIFFIFSPLILCTRASASEHLHPLSDEFIDLINKKGKWRAGRNFPADTPMSHIKRLAGTWLRPAEELDLPSVNHDLEFIKNLPESFDAREKWPFCASLNEIRDQGECGGCWAFGAVEAMTDRYCIYSNGSKNFHFSAQDVVTCCATGNCGGGTVLSAWDYWVDVGIVSGGNYNSRQGCKPYTINDDHTPPCVRACQKGYSVPYQKDRRRGKSSYLVRGMDQLMAELYKNGPIEVSFLVYEDFYNYKKDDIYEHVAGKLAAGHAVKLVGWGVENGKKYWVLANSWGTSWGGMGGFFKMLRGVDECGMEHTFGGIAGDPLFEDQAKLDEQE